MNLSPDPVAVTPVRPLGEVQVTRKKRVFAGPCPKMPKHTNTRIYTTKGRTRYCVCDDCGHQWKQVGELASSGN